MSDSVLDWGIALILSLQNLGDWLIGPMNLVTFTGNIPFFLLILPAIYWGYDQRLGVRVAIILMLSAGLNLILKLALHEPRPYWVDPRVRLLTDPSGSFGLPSGHAQNGVALWGILAAHGQKNWGWAAAIVLIGLVGFSRMFLGVHYPTDVFAGWLIGLAILILFLRFEKPVISWLTRFDPAQQIGGLFAVSLLLILGGAFIATSVTSGWQLPAHWVETASLSAAEEPIRPLSLEELIISASVLFGLGSGVIVLNARGGFDPGGPWFKRVGRYVVGVIGVVILWRGLGILFDQIAIDETLLGYILRYIRFGLIGFWVSAVGPIVFTRLGLVESEQG